MTWDEYYKTSKQTKPRIPLLFSLYFELGKADEGQIAYCVRGPVRSSSTLQHVGTGMPRGHREATEVGRAPGWHGHQSGQRSLSRAATSSSRPRWGQTGRAQEPLVQLWPEGEQTEEPLSLLVGPLAGSQQSEALITVHFCLGWQGSKPHQWTQAEISHFWDLCNDHNFVNVFLIVLNAMQFQSKMYCFL